MKHGNRFIDRTGQVYGRLTARKCVGKNNRNKSLWLCTCACGGTITVPSDYLTSGDTRSCGCLHSETSAALGKATATHGHWMNGKATSTYTSWVAMKRRADNQVGDHPTYKHIHVCSEWQNFEGFLASMGERPEGTTLGRILDRGNYEPGNCFWMTKEEQYLNLMNNNSLRHWEQGKKYKCQSKFSRSQHA